MRRIVVRLVLASGLLGGAGLVWFRYAANEAPTSAQMRVMLTAASIKRDQAGGDDKCLFPLSVRSREVSRQFYQVLLGTEDRQYYGHRFGISFRGIAAAALKLGRSRGGSSIAQQLVKNILFEPGDNRWKRKLFEIPWAVILSERFSKDEILDSYVNHVPFRHGIVGVEAASIYYFGKHAGALNYYEAALLEVMLASPKNDLKSRDAKVRRQTVLKAHTLVAALVRQGVLPRRALNDRMSRGGLAKSEVDCGYVRDFVMREVTRNGWLPPPGATFRIFITVDPLRQAAAHGTVDDLVERLYSRNGSQVSLVDMQRDGRILALQGGVDYAESQFDRAVDSRRSPGSVGKVIVLAEACEQGLSLESPVLDDPLPNGRPRNYDNRYLGRISLRTAFIQSRNAAFFRLAERLGAAKVADRARKFGITEPLPTRDGGIAIGDFVATPLQITAAIAVIADDGYSVAPYAVAGVTTSYGRVLYWHKADGARRRVISAKCARMVDAAMRAVVTSGTGRRADVDFARGKTGTTNDYRDAWYVGYTRRDVVGVWLGNDDQNKQMQGVTGGELPAAFFRDYVERVDRIGRGAPPARRPPPRSGRV